MRITNEQKVLLDSLVVERLRDHKSENASLVNSFSNTKNPVLESIIRTRVSFDRDEEGTVAYYVVKAPTGELLLYFSLKCGELFENLDQFKLDLAFRVRDAVNVLQHKDQYSNDECTCAEDSITEEKDVEKTLCDADNALTKLNQMRFEEGLDPRIISLIAQYEQQKIDTLQKQHEARQRRQTAIKQLNAIIACLQPMQDEVFNASVKLLAKLGSYVFVRTAGKKNG